MGIARRPNGRVHARVKIGGVSFNIGSFESEEAARAAMDLEYDRIRNGTSILLTVSELVDTRTYAANIAVPLGTLKRWIFEGLPCVKLNERHARVDPKIASAWIAQHHPDSVSFARESTIYFVRRYSDGAIKIGWTSDVVRRLTELRKLNEEPVVLIALIPGDKTSERSLHARFSDERLDPNNEWFRQSDRLREFIASIGRIAA